MDGWTTLQTEGQAKRLRKLIGNNLKVYSADKIRYRQMEHDFVLKNEIGRFIGKKGDYLVADASGGEIVLSEKLFQKIL